MELVKLIEYLKYIYETCGNIEVSVMQECDDPRIQLQSKVTDVAYSSTAGVIIIGHEWDE